MSESLFTKSTARTARLYCSKCRAKIKQGTVVVFELSDGRMKNAYCPACSREFEQQVLEDEQHPFDL